MIKVTEILFGENVFDVFFDLMGSISCMCSEGGSGRLEKKYRLL